MPAYALYAPVDPGDIHSMVQLYVEYFNEMIVVVSMTG